MTGTAPSVIAMPRALTLTVLFLGLLLEISIYQVHATGHKAFQNGRLNGALYVGGMDYTSNQLFVTGISYATNGDKPSEAAQCFVSIFSQRNIGRHNATISSNINVGDNRMQGCHTIGVRHDPLIHDDRRHKNSLNQRYVVAGSSDPGLEYVYEDGIYKFGSDSSTPAGFVLGLTPNEENQFNIEQAFSLDAFGASPTVSYPVSVIFTTDMKVDTVSHVYVASLTSMNGKANPNNPQYMLGSNNQPNWLKYYQYGSSFEMQIQKFTETVTGTSTKSIVEDWTHKFSVDPEAERPVNADVYVAGMIIKFEGKEIASKNIPHQLMIVAGSTSGKGVAYGTKQPGTTDEDGFIALMHIMRKDDTNLNLLDHNATIRVGTDKTDLILGICDDPYDTNAFYVVGTTGDADLMGDKMEGHSVMTSSEGSMYGFIKKYSVKGLEPIWGRVWGSRRFTNSGEPTVTAGIGCRVLDDGTMYVVGIAEDGAQATQDHVTEVNGDNILAMRLFTDTGTSIWFTQFGSYDGDEDLARSGALAVDDDKNLIILGQTTGSMFRMREDKTDNASNIFMVKLTHLDGTHEQVIHPSHVDATLKPEIPGIGMLSGGKWKDDEVYGTGLWFNKTGMGIQSGPTPGPVFAGGMVYDEIEDMAYLTGIAYDGTSDSALSSCMITKVPLNPAVYNGFSSATGKIIGTNDVLEVCNSIALHGYGEVVTVGSVDNGSAMLNDERVGAYPMSGFVMALDRYNLQEVDATPLVTEDPTNRLQYPIDVVSDGNDMYIVSLTSTDNSETAEFIRFMENGGHSTTSPNFIKMQKYGKSFDMTVTKVTLEQQMVDGVSMGDKFTTRWSKEFPVNPDNDISGTIPRVFLGGAILNKQKGYLAVSGSTRGFGDGYGAAHGNDEDGYIALVDINTGELTELMLRDNIRVGTSEDDTIFGMCQDPKDRESFYVVGGTKGQIDIASKITETPEGSMQAYLMKIDANNLSTIWTQQLGAVRQSNNGASIIPTVAKAIDCAVQNKTIFVAGIVDDNAAIVVDVMPLNSRGGDDVWVGSFKALDGSINWVRQMGSEGNDHVAPRGAITINKNGNVLVYGDTNGEFYRQHGGGEKTNELFLLEVSKIGAHKPHVRHIKHKETPAPVPAPVPGDPVPAPTPAPVPVKKVPQGTAPPFLVNDISLDLEKSEGKKGGVILMVIVSFVVILLVIVVALFFRRRFVCKETGNGRESQQPGKKDGVFKEHATAPPLSSFRAGDDHLDGCNDNLKKVDGEII